MKFYYQLPQLTYDYTNSKFDLFEFEEALQFYKLIYKDIDTFQMKFLRRLEWIPNLENLCMQLGSNFEKATPISLERICEIDDVTISPFVEHYSEIVSGRESKNGKGFYKNYIRKIKEFLNEDKELELGRGNKIGFVVKEIELVSNFSFY